MQKLTLAHQTMFADLIARCNDATFDEQFEEGGNFTRHVRGERQYFYYLPRRKKGSGERKPIYAGPVDNPDIAQRVQTFGSIKTSYRERRMLVSSLRAAGLPYPDGVTGDVVQALWKAGFFRLRGLLVGTVAFQTYAGLLGSKLTGAALMTSDIDVAQFHAISLLVGDTTPPMGDVLAAVDPSFKPVAHLGDRSLPTAYQNDRGYKVEFLTPNRGSGNHQGRPARMPALGGVGAEPLRYLDFLICHPVNAVLLHKGGVPVSVPAPERYAVHKLIISVLRRSDPNGYAKSGKDQMQAALLIKMLSAERRADDLGMAWMEAWSRGPHWQKRLLDGARRLDTETNQQLVLAIGTACLADAKRPEDYGVLILRR